MLPRILEGKRMRNVLKRGAQHYKVTILFKIVTLFYYLVITYTVLTRGPCHLTVFLFVHILSLPLDSFFSSFLFPFSSPHLYLCLSLFVLVPFVHSIIIGSRTYAGIGVLCLFVFRFMEWWLQKSSTSIVGNQDDYVISIFKSICL